MDRSIVSATCTRTRVAMLAAACLLAIAWPVGQAAEETSIQFVTPRNHSTVVGETPIEIRVTLPPGVRVDRIVVQVDGKEVATISEPPWETSFDAGDASAGHRLEAVGYLSNGTQLRSSISTSALKVQQVEEVALVNVYAVVTDTDGAYVTDLNRDDFRISENGRQQTIERFSAERKPLRIAIVLDTSKTMEGEKLEAARNAALEFLSALEPGDEGTVVTFSDTVEIVQGLTADRSALAAAIRKAAAQAGTALYDAIFRTSNQLEKFDGRRVLVLLSDGRDEASSGLEPGSLHTLDEAMDRALRNEVMIFAIGFGKNLEKELDFYRRQTLAEVFRKLAEPTGGRVIFSSRASRLTKAFEIVAEDLRHQYSLAYISDDPRHDGTWREIRLTSTRPGLHVTGRRGYFAPGASDGAGAGLSGLPQPARSGSR